MGVSRQEMTGSHEFLTLRVSSHPRCPIDSGGLVPSVLGWEGIPANSWDSPLIYGPCHHPPFLSLISGFKTSVTPASERSLHPPGSSRQCGYCQQSFIQPQKVRRKGKILAQGGEAVEMANDGRGGRKPIVVCWDASATVLGPLQVFLLGCPNCTPILWMRTLSLRDLS